MHEYIERETTVKLLQKLGNRDYRREKGTIQDAIKMISLPDYTPTADVEPVRHAYWVPEERVDRISEAVTYRNTRYLCSACGRALVAWEKPIDAPYCHCGAKMDGRKDDG